MLHLAKTTPGGVGGWPPTVATQQAAQVLFGITADA